TGCSDLKSGFVLSLMHPSSSSTLLACLLRLIGQSHLRRRIVGQFPTLYRMQKLPLSRQPAGHHPFLGTACGALSAAGTHWLPLALHPTGHHSPGRLGCGSCCCARASDGSSRVAMISVFSICQPLFFTFFIFASWYRSAVVALALTRGSHPGAPATRRSKLRT